MSNPLPSIKPLYPPEVLEEIGKKSPAARLAAAMGVERKFLRFAEPECISDPQEQYGIHNFGKIELDKEKNYYDDVLCSHPDEQFQNALTLLDSGHLWSIPAGLIVINAPYYLDGSDRGPEGFLAHLICSLASRIERRKARPVTVNFLGTMQLNHPYDLKERHLLVWGPLTDHSSQYDFTKTIQFMYDFRGHTKILLTCTQDLGALLINLKLTVKQITYLFNLGTFITEDKKARMALAAQGKPTEKTPRKSRQAKVKFEAL